MTIPLTVNGVTFDYPENFDEDWGIDATGWAVAMTGGSLQKSGGTFTLTNDVNFGTAFGIKAKYLIDSAANPAAAGFLRLTKTDTLSWRNNANSGDNVLGVDTFDHLTFNGSAITPAGAVNPGTINTLTYYVATGDVVGSLPAITPSRAIVSNTSGLPEASVTTTTELSYVSGVTSALQAQIDALAASVGAGVSVPLGMSILSPTATPPNSNFQLPDGTAISRTTYATLFALIGTTFGIGDGSTTFNKPNLTDKFPVGAGNLYALASTGGAVSHTLTSAELPSSIPVTDPGHIHTVSITDPGHTHVIVAGNANGATSSAQQFNAAAINTTATSVLSSTTGITAGANNNTTGITVGGSGSAHSILNPFLGMYWMMRVI